MLYIPSPLKWCPQCGKIKLTSEFYKHKIHKDGLRSECKNCSVKSTSEYWRVRKDKKSEHDKKYRNSHKEKLANTKREAHLLNPEMQNTRNKRWKQRHKEQVNNSTRRRRSLKRQLPATFTTQDWSICKSWWDNKCAYCEKRPTNNQTLARDHFYPESKMNGYTPDNILPACHGKNGCNNSKGNRDPYLWLIRKFGVSQTEVILNRIAEYFEWVKKNAD